MNFTTLKSRVLKKLNESTSSPKFWSLAEIGDFLNEGYSDLIAVTKVIETSATLSTVANQYVYSLSSSCLAIVRMYYETDDEVIKPLSWQELNKLDHWFNQTTDDKPYNYVPVSTQKVLLYPKVINSESSCITYWFKSISTDMSEDTDSPDLPDAFHQGLVYFACAMALLRERVSSMQTKALDYFAQYHEVRRHLEHHGSIRGNRPIYTRDWI